MPNIEVRALDLSNLTATPLLDEHSQLSVLGLNYIWVYVHDAETDVETHLRFQIADHRMVLRDLPEVVKRVQADFVRLAVVQPSDLNWRATMTHYPVRGMAQINCCAIAIGDKLMVEVFGRWSESEVEPKVDLGDVTKILLAVA